VQQQQNPYVPTTNTPFVPVTPLHHHHPRNEETNSTPLEGYTNIFSPVQQVAGNVLYNMSSPMMTSTQQVGSQWFNSTRTYFRVNNSYVANKLRILLVPFFHKDWKRRRDQNPNMDYLPPTEDLNSPDLYIPTMAFVSYVLLIGLFMGTRLVFTPDVIGDTTSRALLIIIFEVLLVKIVVWLLNFEVILGLLDILSFSGYKFVGSVINVSVGLMLGNTAFYISYIVNSLLFCIFLGKSLRAAIHYPGIYLNSGQDTYEKTKNYLLYSWVLFQFLLIYLLCNKGF